MFNFSERLLENICQHVCIAVDASVGNIAASATSASGLMSSFATLIDSMASSTLLSMLILLKSAGHLCAIEETLDVKHTIIAMTPICDARLSKTLTASSHSRCEYDNLINFISAHVKKQDKQILPGPKNKVAVDVQQFYHDFSSQPTLKNCHAKGSALTEKMVTQKICAILYKM